MAAMSPPGQNFSYVRPSKQENFKEVLSLLQRIYFTQFCTSILMGLLKTEIVKNVSFRYNPP